MFETGFKVAKLYTTPLVPIGRVGTFALVYSFATVVDIARIRSRQAGFP